VIRIQEIKNTLHPLMQAQLLMAVNMTDQGHKVTVCLTAPKVGPGKPRIGGGHNYITLPGVSSDCQIGPLEVHRYVDNRDNQKRDRVGGIYLKVRSITRANGLLPFGWTGVKPIEITGFAILGIETPEPKLATQALAEAATAQTPTGV